MAQCKCGCGAKIRRSARASNDFVEGLRRLKLYAEALIVRSDAWLKLETSPDLGFFWRNLFFFKIEVEGWLGKLEELREYRHASLIGLPTLSLPGRLHENGQFFSEPEEQVLKLSARMAQILVSNNAVYSPTECKDDLLRLWPLHGGYLMCQINGDIEGLKSMLRGFAERLDLELPPLTF